MNVTLNIFWIVVIIAVLILFYFVKECFFKEKDTGITNNIIDKYPLVNLDFRKKSLREQTIENNQEIHDKTKRIMDLEDRVEKLEKYIEIMNDKIDKQLIKIIKELEKNG